jgi:hypothetical protein
MVDVAVIEIVKQIDAYLKNLSASNEEELMLGNISQLESAQDSSGQTLKNRLIASVVKIEQEFTLRNANTNQQALDNSGKPVNLKRRPDLHLNFFVLFAANYAHSQYEEGLKKISHLITFFQRRNVFTPANTPPFGVANIDKLIWELHPMSFEELNHLWSINGGKYLPSVLYKVRMVLIEDINPAETEVITEVGATPEPI